MSNAAANTGAKPARVVFCKVDSGKNTQRLRDRVGQAAETWTRPVSQRVNPAELMMVTTELSVMLDSGVVLSDALDAIAEQMRPGSFRMILSDIADRIKSGDSFSAALANYPRIFNAMFVSMVKASEASGNMGRMLEVLGGYLNAEAETRKKVKGALIYPFIMMMMAIAATGTLMFFVLPRFMRIYEARGAALPKLTQVLVSFSRLLGNLELMTMLLTVGFFAGVGLYFWARTCQGRRTIDFMKVRAPVLGTMFIDTVVTRSMRITATMVNTGVNLLDAIRVTHDSCENYYFQRLWSVVDEKIRAGLQLSEAITVSPYSELISPAILQMLRAGEKSGRLGQVCDKVSTFYEKKLEHSIRNVTALIEPLMILIMGVVIGTIAIALLLPVFRISQVIAH
jgi:type IV pilus assembly protein PilC